MAMMVRYPGIAIGASEDTTLPNPGRWFACQHCGHWTELTQNGLAVKCQNEQRDGRRYGVVCDGCLFRMFVEGGE